MVSRTKNMIAAVCWVPKGASKSVPVIAETPKEEIEEMLKVLALERSGGEDEDTNAAAPKEEGDNAGGLEELDMDHYDDEDEGIQLFSASHGDLYYESNDMDPYLRNKNDSDDDGENDDMIIRPTDAVIVCACCKDEDDEENKFSKLEIWIYEELDDGDSYLYVHHDINLPAPPLCAAWLDCNLKSTDKGNFIAVGSMEPAIEIWDLDLIGEFQAPSMILGGLLNKKEENGKKSSTKYRKGSHRRSILGLAWNKEIRNVLASASADKSVKIWDVITGECAVTLNHHNDKVQAVAWSQHSPEVLLSGSFDQSVVMVDTRSGEHSHIKWSVLAEVERLAWDPFNENSFVASLSNGIVQGFDRRAASSNSTSASKPTFTLHAHEAAVSSVSFNPSVPNLLVTGSEDKMVKLWDVSNNQPSCVATQNPRAGAVFCVSFSEDRPFLLVIGASKGRPKVWNTLSDTEVVRRFGKYYGKQRE